MDIQIVEATGKNAMNYFIRFPKELYRNDPYYIVEPEGLQRELLSKKNPFFKHSSARFYIAIAGGRIAGRIAAIANTVHNQVYHEKTGFFGFFDTIESYEVARILLDQVMEIHNRAGMDRLIGPTNFTTNDACGVLVSGFDKHPVVGMPYNKPYYNDFLVRYGFEKEMDVSSCHFGAEIIEKPYFGRSVQANAGTLQHKGISIRTINYKQLESEVAGMREVYNTSNRDNWGFIPLNQEEFLYMVRQLKKFVPEELIFIAEVEGKQVGFLVTLPDMNQVFRRIPSGKLWPFGFIQYLWHKRKITRVRIIMPSILKGYRNQGIDLAMYEQLRQNLLRLGYREGETSTVEGNDPVMHSIFQKTGLERKSEYRIYRRNI